MPEVKAIETISNGYRFRSRLEARWAVFFDEAGIPYEYEKEGFIVDGKPYLPDFYLPWFNCYAEIKPNDTEIIESCEETIIKFSESTPILLCMGEPYNDIMKLYDKLIAYDCMFAKGCTWLDRNKEYLFGCSKQHIIILCKTKDIINFSGSSIEGTCNYCLGNFSSSNIVSIGYDFKEEKKIARQARFEHGEKPKKKRGTKNGKI